MATTTLHLMMDAVCLSDFESLAQTQFALAVYAYISGGAADELTVRWNREAFDRIRLRPRILTDVSQLDTRVQLLGHELAFPILLAPTAYHKAIHPEGEIATAQGAGAAGAILCVSSNATTSVEEIAAVATQPLWFQLYIQRDRAFTRELVQRVEAAGYQALCVSVDSPVLGARNRETRAQFVLPPGLSRVNLKVQGTERLDPAVTWKDIEWLRSFARVPVVLKGILNPLDAAQAVQVGADGLIVSNHGGRGLDTLPATIDTLPEVVATVAGRVPVLMDGGVRRGTDVLKALALGAQAVLIGRPYLYGLGVAGAAGVTRVVNILRHEFEMAMALTGRQTLAQIDRAVLWGK
ncbi:MAG TPA: alpha-hydroxy acid oxidase [Blastocatellia bacterium]|nr:alpha-hydroxy acid oxidase [Blastocatellia bacterium]